MYLPQHGGTLKKIIDSTENYLPGDGGTLVTCL